MSLNRKTLDINYVGSILELGESIKKKLVRKKDVAKIEVAMYMVEEFNLYKENDFYNKNNRRAEQVVHAYTLFHSLFKKHLRHTAMHTEGKLLDTLFHEFARQALQQIANVVNEMRADACEDILENIKDLQRQMQDAASDDEAYVDEDEMMASTEPLNSSSAGELVWVDAPTAEEQSDLSVKFIDPIEADSEISPIPHTQSSPLFFKTPRRASTPYPRDVSLNSSTESIHYSGLEDSEDLDTPHELERTDGFRWNNN